MILLPNTRDILPQILPQTVTRLQGERLVITFPKGWRWQLDSAKASGTSPVGDATVDIAGFKGFETISTFENWLFSQARFYYRQVGAALVYVPFRQFGVGQSFAVNNLDIVIREYQDDAKLNYLGVAGVSLRNVSVAVIFTAAWHKMAEYRKIFVKSLTTVRFISENLL